jgi:glycosyltransferase involved in cell wall biosynthesis
MRVQSEAATEPAPFQTVAASQIATNPERLIVHIVDELKVGGAQTHLVTMIRQAIDAHPQVRHRVFSLFNDGPIGDQLRELGVPVDILDLRPYFARRRFLGAARVLAERLRMHQPDLVEAHLTWSRLLGLFAAWRAGVSCRIGFEQGDIYLNSWKFRVANFVGQHWAHRVIACSHTLADWNHRVHGISRGRLAVFHNCVDFVRMNRPQNPSEIVELGLPESSTVFAMVGTLGRGVNKRADIGIRAIAAARAADADVALVICGDGDQRAELEALGASLGVDPWLRFLGMRNDIPAILTACDAFCHAAPFEPFGIACIEAMAMGLPVLIPNSGGVREAVDDGVTGLIYPALDHQALAVAMRRLHEEPDRRRVMGQVARRSVEERFDVKGYVDRLYKFYGLA